MIKLKQILLEALGDCYQAGGRLIMNFFGDKDHKLVHGMVNGQGPLSEIRFGHCWVESKDTVLDHSNGKKEEAVKFMVDKGHWGPWEMSGDTVMAEEIPDSKGEVGKHNLRIKPEEKLLQKKLVDNLFF
mgnify:CR=1 FL=1